MEGVLELLPEGEDVVLLDIVQGPTPVGLIGDPLCHDLLNSTHDRDHALLDPRTIIVTGFAVDVAGVGADRLDGHLGFTDHDSFPPFL